MLRRSAIVGAVVALSGSGCVGSIATQCPACAIVDARHPLSPVHPKAERLFILVPGALGFGDEWQAAVAALRQTATVDFVVFDWDPWASINKTSRQLRHVLQATLARLPPSATEVVVVAHSAGGMIAAHALGGLVVPPGKLLSLVTIATPFAGMKESPFCLDDVLDSPLLISIVSTFRRYPDPPPRVRVVEYVTEWPGDPVMQPHFGHEVAPADVGPRGARRVRLGSIDHNSVLAGVVKELLQSRRLADAE